MEIAIFDSFKKRICARCLCTHPAKSFSIHCIKCDQVYFCSTICADKYLTDHPMICDALRKLATLKKVDRHMKSIGKLILMVYWQRYKDKKTSFSHSQSYEPVQQLESHYTNWSDELKKEWSRLHLFLSAQLQQLHWLCTNESEMDIMHLASKIESNGFGIYLENKLDVVAGRGKKKKNSQMLTTLQSKQ